MTLHGAVCVLKTFKRRILSYLRIEELSIIIWLQLILKYDASIFCLKRRALTLCAKMKSYDLGSIIITDALHNMVVKLLQFNEKNFKRQKPQYHESMSVYKTKTVFYASFNFIL